MSGKLWLRVFRELAILEFLFPLQRWHFLSFFLPFRGNLKIIFCKKSREKIFKIFHFYVTRIKIFSEISKTKAKIMSRIFDFLSGFWNNEKPMLRDQTSHKTLVISKSLRFHNSFVQPRLVFNVIRDNFRHHRLIKLGQSWWVQFFFF